MLEVFLFVVTVVLVVLFWPIFAVLGLVALALVLLAMGLVILAAVGVLAFAYPKVVLPAAVLGLVAWAVYEFILDSGAYQSWADRQREPPPAPPAAPPDPFG